MLICGKTFNILTISGSAASVGLYSGAKKTFADKFASYTGFVHSCFVAPPHKIVAENNYDIIESLSKPEYNKAVVQYKYCQEPLSGISWYGVSILALSFAAMIINRKKPFAQIAFCWILFSFLLIGIAGWGWGPAENTNFLYTPLFSWAFTGLLYMLVVKCLKKPVLRYTATGGFIVLLLSINIPDFVNVIRFSLTYYPR
jgi:hypothetical protein